MGRCGGVPRLSYMVLGGGPSTPFLGARGGSWSPLQDTGAPPPPRTAPATGVCPAARCPRRRALVGGASPRPPLRSRWNFPLAAAARAPAGPAPSARGTLRPRPSPLRPLPRPGGLRGGKDGGRHEDGLGQAGPAGVVAGGARERG